MGRNAQKRRARRARRAPDDKDASRQDRPVAPPPPRRGPLWLEPGLEHAFDPGAEQDDEPRLTLAALAAAGAELDDVMARAAEGLGADAALIAKLVPGFGVEPLGAFRKTRPAKESGLDPLLTEVLVRDVATAGAPILLRDVPRDPRTPAIPPSSKTGSLLVSALCPAEGGAPWGVLAFGRREVGAFFERDVDICAQLAADLGPDLDQARHLHRGLTDPLTGLLSRRAVLLLVTRGLERARRRERSLAALVLEPDLGEEGSSGHAAGVVRTLAFRLAESVRAAELCGRLLGRELLLLLDADRDEGLAAAERILEDVAAAPLAPGHEVTVSAGLAVAGPDEPGPSLLARARAALRAAQAQGGARIARSEGGAGPAADEEEGEGEPRANTP